MIEKKALSSTEARRILDAGLDLAAAAGLRLSIVVVDEGGYPLALQRMDGAGLLTPKVATAKAFTAALLRIPSALIAGRLQEEPALLALSDYLPMPGGVPIIVDGQCVGAVGVSGGTAADDVTIAQGAAAVALN